MNNQDETVESILKDLQVQTLKNAEAVKGDLLGEDLLPMAWSQRHKEAVDRINRLHKQQMLKRETELLDSLYWMYSQYCNSKWGHQLMSAGETASALLEEAGYIKVNNIGVIVEDNGDSEAQRQELMERIVRDEL